MKKSLLLFFAIFLITPVMAMAAGTVTVSGTNYGLFYHVTWTCVGDAADGSIPDTDIPTELMDTLQDRKLHLFDVIYTLGATAPDAADAELQDDNGVDLLEGSGAALISATADGRIGSGMAYYPASSGDTITLNVTNQATNSATYTITAVFVP